MNHKYMLLEQVDTVYDTVAVRVGRCLDFASIDRVMGELEVALQARQRIVIDLSQTEWISSSGMLAVYNVAQLMLNKTMLDSEDGWSALYQMRDHILVEPSGLCIVCDEAAAARLRSVGLDQLVHLTSTMEEALLVATRPQMRLKRAAERRVQPVSAEAQHSPVGWVRQMMSAFVSQRFA